MQWRWNFIIAIFVFLPIIGSAQAQPEQYVCGGKYKDGGMPDQAALKKILEDHVAWLESGAKENDTRQANLCNADLFEAELSGVDLSGADLSGATLFYANLSMTNLSRVNLTGAILRWADLHGANLTGAHLNSTFLRDADLSKADLSKADLRNAELSWANLNGANLKSANLGSANLNEADLRMAKLHGAYITNDTQINKKWKIVLSILNETQKQRDLSEKDLSWSDLSGANLEDFDLTGADLRNADLKQAELINTNRINAKLSNVNLENAIYEPISSPDKAFLSQIQNLSTVRFGKEKQSGLALLRNSLKEVGLRELERQATYAIEKGKTDKAFSGENTESDKKDFATSEKGIAVLTSSWLESVARRLFFEHTAGYGLYPGRCLIILLTFIPVFALIYFFFVYKATEQPQHRSLETLFLPPVVLEHRKNGIYRIWLNERIRKDLGSAEPELVTAGFIKSIGYALYFSLLSAFHIGWRDINVGNWIARIQPREYTLRSTGWIRTVSGIQSLISIYLLAFWILTQFGRPFD